MPDEPPAAFLVSGEDRTPGVRYVADWPTTRRPIAQRPTTPVPWPSEFLTVHGSALSIAFVTTIEPDHLVVHAYRELDASGEPTGEAAETYECDGFSTRACRFVHDGKEIRLDGVPFVADAPYVVVFAYWHIPVTERLHPDVANASGSWLFRVGASAS